MSVRNWSYSLGNDISIEKWYLYWNLTDNFSGLYFLCKSAFCITSKTLKIQAKKKERFILAHISGFSLWSLGINAFCQEQLPQHSEGMYLVEENTHDISREAKGEKGRVAVLSPLLEYMISLFSPGPTS